MQASVSQSAAPAMIGRRDLLECRRVDGGGAITGRPGGSGTPLVPGLPLEHRVSRPKAG